jgi:prepilin-type N-terminal cleavage/methylation domain-containing protein
MKFMGTTAQAKRNGHSSVLRNNKGFTLVELAIVLVIIGLILGSVLKGKDLINSAKQKQFYNAFVKTWELSIISYYDRTGYLLGDGGDNGGVAGSAPNGVFDAINSAAEFTRVNTALEEKGLEVPETNTATSHNYSFTGAYSGNQNVTLYLYNRTNYGQTNNTMLLLNVPTDLAYALDKIIDGQVDATEGKCVLDQGAVGATWGNAQTLPRVNVAIRIDVP